MAGVRGVEHLSVQVDQQPAVRHRRDHLAEDAEQVLDHDVRPEALEVDADDELVAGALVAEVELLQRGDVRMRQHGRVPIPAGGDPPCSTLGQRDDRRRPRDQDVEPG